MLRPVAPADTPALVALGKSTGIFRENEAEALLGGVLEELHAGRLGEGHQARVWDDDSPAGWTYFAPSAMADGVWDLWWIGVSPDRQGRGIGGALLDDVETHVRAAGGRILIVETSSLPKLELTRRFYLRRGYSECGLVADFYADGDGKVIFAKRISGGVHADC